MSAAVLLQPMTPHDRRAVAVRAGVDPRTVRAFVDGAAQRSTVASRIEAALVDLGFIAARELRETAAE